MVAGADFWHPAIDVALDCTDGIIGPGAVHLFPVLIRLQEI